MTSNLRFPSNFYWALPGMLVELTDHAKTMKIGLCESNKGDYGVYVGTFYSSDVAIVLAEHERWFLLLTSSGAMGWTSGGYLQKHDQL